MAVKKSGRKRIAKTAKRYEKKEPRTSSKVKRIAAIGLKKPKRLTSKQVQSLAGSVARHEEPRRAPVKRKIKRTLGRSRRS
jgi:hypothetical protein